MGISHRKKLRRHIDFYQTAFGFYEPFKILVDGNFLHQVEYLKQGDAFELVQSSFSRRIKLFCTPCILNELEALGAAFEVTSEAAKALALHNCQHAVCVSAADCLISCIGDANTDHWWVASQDVKLREALNAIPGAPCLFLTFNGVFIETPSEASRNAAEKARTDALGVSEWELKTEALKDLEELSQKHGPSIFRKRKAKGPNPLSCLKKSKRDMPLEKVSDQKPKRKRRKKKSEEVPMQTENG